MGARDPAKEAINKQIDEMTRKLEILRPHVMHAIGSNSLPSLHAVLGGKNAKFIDIKTRVFTSPDAFYIEWLQGLEKYIDSRADSIGRYSSLIQLICDDDRVEEYVSTFLKRTFLRHVDSLSKKRPTDSEAEIWLGPNNADYGLLITPRFKNGQWENDKSEIRHFKCPYFTIEHVLKTGLVIPGRPKTVSFSNVGDYLNFFENTLVRLAGSPHQDAIAQRYVAHVEQATNPESTPLLLPEVRYSREKAHKYRLDFMIIEPSTMLRVGFELSPWSTHGRLTGTRGMSQTLINEKASRNREAELAKVRDYFLDHGISTMIFTDTDLKDHDNIFRTMAKYMRPPKVRTQQQAEVMARLRRRSMGTTPGRASSRR